ncbi:MAG: hypothetical protein AVDCRST_MAG42-3079, partial [uncultured Chthoniobacterales bacterium]
LDRRVGAISARHCAVGTRRARGDFRALILAYDAATDESPPAVVGESLRAHDPREQGAVAEVLLDGAHGILTGEIGGAHVAAAILHWGRLLHVDFEDGAALVELRGADEVNGGEHEPRDDARDQDPNSLERCVPEASEVEAAAAFSTIGEAVRLRQSGC